MVKVRPTSNKFYNGTTSMENRLLGGIRKPMFIGKQYISSIERKDQAVGTSITMSSAYARAPTRSLRM